MKIKLVVEWILFQVQLWYDFTYLFFVLLIPNMVIDFMIFVYLLFPPPHPPTWVKPDLRDSSVHLSAGSTLPQRGGAFEPRAYSAEDVGVRLRKVKKVWNGEKVAVDGVSLDLLRGEVLALLGHNGAGKSSLLATLVGATPLTSGK